MPPLEEGAKSHLPEQALNTAPRHSVPTALADSRREPPRRSQRPLSAASTAAQPTPAPPRRRTRLAYLRDNLADREEQHATRRARNLQRTGLPQGPAMRTRSKTNLHTASQQQNEHVERPPAGPAARTPSKTQEAMLAFCDTRQRSISAQTLRYRRFPKEVLAAVLNEDTGELM